MSRFLEPLMGRRWVAWGAFGLAVLLLVAASLTVWVKRQALDTDNWVDTSGRLLRDDSVRQLVATDLADAVFSSTDVQRRLEGALPPRLAPFVAPATGLLREAARSAAYDLLGRSDIQRLWADANRQAHRRLVAVLDGRPDPYLSTSNGAVVLDLRPLAQQLAGRLGIRVTLPAGVGLYTVLRADQLEAGQDAVRAVRVLSVWLGVLAVALLAFAIYIARGFRREMLRALAVAVIVVGVLLLIARRVVGDAVVSSLTDAATRDAGDAVWRAGTGLLHDEGVGLIVYGAVLLAGVALAGTTRWAVRLRALAAPLVRRNVLAVHAAVVAVLLLTLWLAPSSTGRRLVGVLVLAALAVAGAEVLRRQILRENPAPHG